MTTALQQTLLGLKALHQHYAAADETEIAGEVELIWSAVLQLPGAAEANQALEGIHLPAEGATT